MNPIFGEKDNSLINMTLGDLLDRTASLYPDVDGVVYADRPFRLTYKSLKRSATRLQEVFLLSA